MTKTTFTVTSDGTTGEQWIKRLEKAGYYVGFYAKQVLLSLDFKPTKGITTEIVILKGEEFDEAERTTETIRRAATVKGYTAPNAEVACLIREKFTGKEIEAMGLWCIVAMHDPIKDSYGDPNLLGARRGDGGCKLDAYGGRPGDGWYRGDGFAFAVSQVGAKDSDTENSDALTLESLEARVAKMEALFAKGVLK